MVARQSYENMRKTSQLSGEKIKLIDIRTNIVQHSHECCATVVRIKMEISYIPGKVVREPLFSKLDRNLRICRINVCSMRLQRETVKVVFILSIFVAK